MSETLISDLKLEGPAHLVTRVRNGLRNENIHTLEYLASFTKNDILKIPNFSVKSIAYLENLLERHNLKFTPGFEWRVPKNLIITLKWPGLPARKYECLATLRHFSIEAKHPSEGEFFVLKNLDKL